MSIIGKWKVALAASFDENGIVWLTPDKYRESNSDNLEETEQTLGAIMEFTEDGKALYCVPIPSKVPQEQIDEAVKAGELLVKDGYSYDVKPWKEENGLYLYDTGIQGEIFEEETSSWETLTIEDDGTLNFMNMLRFEKI